MSAPGQRPAPRGDGYAPLRSYAAIGDGRTVGLVADDGAIDWLTVPNLDSPSVFAALLDAESGGSFTLAPAVSFSVSRRYLPRTNVLETTYFTEMGVVRVLDALTMRGNALGPFREVQRRVEGVSGRVPMSWRVRARFGYGQRSTRVARRAGLPVASCGNDALVVRSFDAGAEQVDTGVIEGRFTATAGSSSLLALCAAHQEPLLFPTRSECDARFEETVAAWQQWAGTRGYNGPWQEAVIRSALVLKLLVYAPSGAVAAAATTSLPEQLGGQRNWDYRFSWVRDSAFTLDALLRLGCVPEAHAYFWWLAHATQLTHPRLRPLYRLDGGAHARERTLPLDGYRGSRPVRIGNAAGGQLQLDVYGELLQTAWLYAKDGGELDPGIGRRLAGTADLVSRRWQEPDAGIWEVRSTPAQFTQSKMMCWVALDRAMHLADRGLIPSHHRQQWREHAATITDYIEQHCFSPQEDSYTRFADSTELDASVLLGLLSGYGQASSPRWRGTIDALQRKLSHGPFVYRYTGEDGLPGTEGAFVTCSFWLAEALARTGRISEATSLMNQLVGLANDVGLYAEEIDPNTRAFLGDLPQGLSHLALISAATAIAEEDSR